MPKRTSYSILRETESVCPECFQVIQAHIFIDNKGEVRIGKECAEHGYYEDSYTFSDPDLYQWAEQYTYEGDKPENPTHKKNLGCPYDCGLCPDHKSQTVLAIIDITNRCNLRCPICFAIAATSGYIYELSKKQIENIMKNLRAMKPVPPPALQFSGGEPTIRDDLPDLIISGKEIGFEHIEVNTNGIRFAEDIDFMKRCIEAGMDTVYLQFDGLDDKIYKKSRGTSLMKIKRKAIENARKQEFHSIVLVVTLVKELNDHQIGDIIQFAIKNSDVIRCINFQPVSITGRIDKKSREAMRINTTDFMKLIERQTNGLIGTSDFRPVPSVIPISEAVGALKKKKYVKFSTAPWCGVATFIIQNKDGTWTPITKLVKIDKFFKAMEKVADDVEKGKRLIARLRILASLRHVKTNIIREILWPVLKEGNYQALGRFMHKVIMIGCMHFMDPYNFDIQRVQSCVIHYGLPDGTIRPFCTYNTLHRRNVESNYSIPYAKWLKKHKKDDVKIFKS